VITTLLGLVLSIAAPAIHAADPPSYAGTWTLDAARSTNLPEYYSRVKRHTLVITQTPARLNVSVEIDNGMPETMKMELPYPLDGTEAHVETSMRMPSGPVAIPTTLKAALDPAGAVHITITRQMPMPSGPVTAQMREDWTLSPDGRTLNVHMIDDGPRGHRESDYVFLRR